MYMKPKNKSVSKVKNKRDIKITPMDSNKKTVVFDDIDIFLKDRVGILLTSNNDIKIVKYGVTLLIFKSNFKVLNSYINGIKIKIPPAGDGTPSKKLFFQVWFSSTFVKLNLANLRTQHTE